MIYMIVSEDNESSLPLRAQARPAHLARLEILQQQGRLLLAGPNPAIDTENPGEAGFSGSLIVARFDSLKAAREWAEQDPYVAAGVYHSVSVKPFRQVFPQP